MSDSLGDRMKTHEKISRVYLPRRLPVIIRVDGRAFHTFTRGFQRPFDEVLAQSMWETAKALCKEISGAKLAYTQSDEISVLVTNNDTLDTQPWFDNNLQKLVSISASIATLGFNKAFKDVFSAFLRDEDTKGEGDDFDIIHTYFNSMMKAQFDARAFVLPPDEVCNYFIWRQQDAVRNSIQMVAQSLYSHKELQHKNQAALQDMLMEKGVNWNDYPTPYKRGVCLVKKQKIVSIGADLSGAVPVIRNQWVVDKDIPIFTQYRDYIERWLKHDDP